MSDYIGTNEMTARSSMATSPSCDEDKAVMAQCSMVSRGLGKGSGGAIFWGLVITAMILQNVHDLTILMTEGRLTLYQFTGPIYHKASKDLIYFGLYLLSLRSYMQGNGNSLQAPQVILHLIIIVMFFISALSNDLLIAALGVRWIIPLLIFVIVKNFAFGLSKVWAVGWLVAAQLACLLMQIYQLTNMPPVFGEIAAGYSARVPGLFIAPNSTVFFTCSVAALAMSLSSGRRAVLILSVLMAVFTCTLCQSGTGIVAVSMIIIWALFGASRSAFLMVGAVVSLQLVINLNEITQRDDYLNLSGGGRVDVFLGIFERSYDKVSNFGVYTNAANLQSDSPEHAVAADSLVASFLGNLGPMSLVVMACVFSAVNRSLAVAALRGKISGAMPLIIVFTAFSFTTIVFEAFPMNLILPIGFWMALNNSPRRQLVEVAQ